MRNFQILVAATRELGIGINGKLPWKLKHDMQFFKEITTEVSSNALQNAVIMGRKTWESIPPKFRPLKGRLNIVLTRNSEVALPQDVMKKDSFDSALSFLSTPTVSSTVDKIFVIGGGEIYKEAWNSPLCEAIHLTEVQASIPCDTFIPEVDTSIFKLWRASEPVREGDVVYSFLTYVRSHQQLPQNGNTSTTSLVGNGHVCIGDFSNRLPKSVYSSHEEFQYLNLIRDIIDSGNKKGDRTGTGTFSKFGCHMRFNLRKSFPLLTTKRVFWRAVVEELLWFISGSTDARILQKKGIGIWDGNASKEYLESIGLDNREAGDLGPVYGFQWRHFGAQYTNMHADYSGEGFDQLADVINKIKNKPEDRRIVMSAWNPSDLSEMALPPCHMFSQFYVANGELSCQMYQRSCDLGLGVPFNIASYSLLTVMIAHVCGLTPGDFIHVLGDTHVYLNHIEPLKKQLQNEPKPFPVLKINTQKSDIDSFAFEDFTLVGYEPHKKIEMKMAV